MSESDKPDYLWDRSGPADAEVARLEELMAPLGHDAPLDELRLRRRRRPWIAVAAVGVAAAAALVAWWQWPRTSTTIACDGATGFTFTGKGGSVVCGGAEVASGSLPVGVVLDTGAHEADLAIADIGTARLGANTKIRLDRTSQTGHHLSLEQGHMHARVVAPPRLFTVSTPHTEVTDLGCEYTIQIDRNGAGQIRVQTGKVELQTKSGAIVVAPARTSTAILPGQVPGLPLDDGANAALLSAVEAYQRGDEAAVPRIVAAAGPTDAITLINLAAVLEGRDAKLSVLVRLAELVAPPMKVSPDAACTDPKSFESWRTDVIVGRGGPPRK